MSIWIVLHSWLVFAQVRFLEVLHFYAFTVNSGTRFFFSFVGDIILAINGRNVQNETHQQLVVYIGQCSSLRMVVLFENCVNRIELCARAIKLKVSRGVIVRVYSVLVYGIRVGGVVKVSLHGSTRECNV